MTPAEYGRLLADQAGPLTDEQVDHAARILAPLSETTGRPLATAGAAPTR